MQWDSFYAFIFDFTCRANRDAKQKLEMDWSDKKEAHEIDNRCGMLRDHHTDKQFYPGSAKFQEKYVVQAVLLTSFLIG